MKNKFLFLLLLSSLLFVAACSDTSSSKEEEVETKEEIAEDNENDSVEETSEAASKEEENTGITEEEALSIAKEINESLLSTAKSEDIEGFHSLYSTEIDQTVVNQDLEFFKSTIGDHEDLDIRVLFHTDDVIGASIYEYTNLVSETGKRNHSNNSYKLYLENIDGSWVFSGSENVQKALETAFYPKIRDIYGDEFVENGFTSAGHPYLFDVVLTNTPEADVYKMMLQEDNSLEVVIAVQNGLDNDIYNFSFQELILSNANDTPFADLSGYALDSTDVIESKTIKLIPLTIPAEELLISPDEFDTSYVRVSSRMNYDNRAN